MVGRSVTGMDSTELHTAKHNVGVLLDTLKFELDNAESALEQAHSLFEDLAAAIIYERDQHEAAA